VSKLTRCRKCGRKAVIKLKDYRISLCERCYPEFYEQLVERSIRKHKMIKNKEKIIAAISGGKDSVALASVLTKLSEKMQLEVELLYIDLGIKSYSKFLKNIVKKVSNLLDLNLNTVSVKNYGFSIDDTENKKVCSVCGVVKRYLMNKTARELGFDVIATGHTSEDFIEFFFKNTLSGNYELNCKLVPRIDSFDGKIVTKIRPLFDRTEKENMFYVLCKNLPFSTEICPHAPRRDWKEIIYYIELKKPGFKRAFVTNLAKFMRPNIKKDYRYCKLCGEVSNSEICSFCRIINKYSKFNGVSYDV